MTVRNHEAKKKFWAQYTPEQRSLLISIRVKKMWKNKTAKEKTARALLMLKAKKVKSKLKLQHNEQVMHS